MVATPLNFINQCTGIWRGLKLAARQWKNHWRRCSVKAKKSLSSTQTLSLTWRYLLFENVQIMRINCTPYNLFVCGTLCPLKEVCGSNLLYESLFCVLFVCTLMITLLYKWSAHNAHYMHTIQPFCLRLFMWPLCLLKKVCGWNILVSCCTHCITAYGAVMKCGKQDTNMIRLHTSFGNRNASCSTFLIFCVLFVCTLMITLLYKWSAHNAH